MLSKTERRLLYSLARDFADDGVQVGESFRPRFDAHVARFDVPHDVHEGDITKIGWSGGPIDVLFLDVLKSWEINDAVLRDFFPSLVPGRSVIVHQDYGWGDTPWIPITVELMRDSLVLVRDRMVATGFRVPAALSPFGSPHAFGSPAAPELAARQPRAAHRPCLSSGQCPAEYPGQ